MKRVDNPTLLLQELMRRDFRAFLRKAFPTIRGGDEILWNWHLDAIAYELDRIDRGENQRLLVTLPPRNLKSIAISVAWVAWMLGRDPRRNFVCISYSNELSGKLARDCLAIMQSGWYRSMFPRTILSPKRSASGDFETTRGGGRLATSITGTLTGRGGDILIIDDPIKPDEVYSDTAREGVNNWYRSTLTSRLNDKASGAIVTVMQRLHENDLAGMLLETPGWRELRLSAIAAEDEIIALSRRKVHYRKAGDVLHPERESLEVLQAQRLAMGSSAFEAQYQQNPIPAVGNMVKAEWLRIYTDIELAEKPGRIVQSWDTASKDGVHNDYSVCITASIHRNEIRILDVFRAKAAFPELKQAAIRLARQYRARTILIEDAASGQQLLQVLRNEQPRGVPMPISRKPEGDKLSRMAGVSGQIEGGQLLLPEDAPWLAEFKKELLGFPNARHDDQADALTQLMSWGMQWDYGRDHQQILGEGAVLFVNCQTAFKRDPRSASKRDPLFG
ncbi:MAG: phage terminase large subunit [Sphingopyxis sp.]|nr:phage terminase large subunit [Sphingopyxis sp.]